MRPKLLFLCQTLPYPPDGGLAASATAEGHCGWNVVGEELIKTYLQVTNRASCDSPQPALATAGAGYGTS